MLEGVSEILPALSKSYRLILATKGDLLDQNLKLDKSGLRKYFRNVEVMNEKNEEDYLEIFERLNINPSEFLMIGNSLKSDIIPVLNIGGYAVYVPYHTTWLNEMTDEKIESPKFFEVSNLRDILDLLNV